MGEGEGEGWGSAAVSTFDKNSGESDGLLPEPLLPGPRC